MVRVLYAQHFPKLVDPFSKKTSEPTASYNCIAWAFGDNTRWWWPMKRRYWPLPFDGITPMEAFLQLFLENGWEATRDRSLEKGVSKIALYANLLDGIPTHAARQLPSGLWTSKLGEDMDLSHQLDELEGPTYGVVFSIFKKL